MESDWYYHSNGQTSGPLSRAELCDELGRRQNWRDELVWHPTLAQWTYADTLFQLTLQSAPKSFQPSASEHAHDGGDDSRTIPAWMHFLTYAGLAVLGMFAAFLWRWLT